MLAHLKRSKVDNPNDEDTILMTNNNQIIIQKEKDVHPQGTKETVLMYKNSYKSKASYNFVR